MMNLGRESKKKIDHFDSDKKSNKQQQFLLEPKEQLKEINTY